MNIIMDVNSGSVHITDDLTYRLVQGLNEGREEEGLVDELAGEYKEAEIWEALDEIHKLKEEGTLFSEDFYEPLIPYVMERKTVVKALCLHIAHDCNLACKYCFAEEGEYHGNRCLMSAEVGKKALDFLVRSSQNRRNLEVDFFGGEPLLNFKVIKEIVEYGRSLEEEWNKKFRFTLTTNGVLVNQEVIDFCEKEMSNVVLSLDGRKEVHDAMRPFRGGKGSYERILPRLQDFAKAREKNHQDYFVRGTFTRHNLDFTDDVLHFAEKGFTKLSMEPAVGPEDTDWAVRPEDVERVKEEYERLADALLAREEAGEGVNFFHFMIDLGQGPCISKRLSGCGSGTEYLAVTPEGDFYPCHQFVGIPEFKLGSVFEGITKPEIQGEFRCINVYTKEDCKTCFARYYCSGGCAANSFHNHGHLVGTDPVGCELERKRVEIAIMMEAVRALRNQKTEEEKPLKEA